MDANVQSVITKHRQRAARGLEKYGVDTTRSDLTAEQWVQELQDELMDGAVYCERMLAELGRLRTELSIGMEALKAACTPRHGGPVDWTMVQFLLRQARKVAVDAEMAGEAKRQGGET